MCGFTMVINGKILHLISTILRCRSLNNLYFEAVCKLHKSCIRLNIIYESYLWEVELLVLKEKIWKEYAAGCVAVTHVGRSVQFLDLCSY